MRTPPSTPAAKPPDRDHRGRPGRAARRARHLRRRHDHDRHHEGRRHPDQQDPAGHADHHRLPARLHRGDAAAGPRVGPIRSQAADPDQPGRIRGRARSSPRCRRPDHAWSSDASSRAPPAARCCPSRWRWPPTCGRTQPGRRSSVASVPRRNSAACSGRSTASRRRGLLSSWRYVFWINIPLALIAMVMIHFSVPGRGRATDPPEKVDVVGGLLLAVVLGARRVRAVQPDSRRQAGAAQRRPAAAGRAPRVVAVAFFVWEQFVAHQADRPGRRALPTVPGGARRLVRRGRGADGHAGQRRTVRPGRAGLNQNEAAFLLMWFLGALPVGALIGGFIATQDRRPDRRVRRTADRGASPTGWCRTGRSTC